MSDDRNEGECYGPFHAGFICHACANRIRALEDQAKKQMARARALETEKVALGREVERAVRVLTEKLNAETARAEKAEAELAAAEELLERGRFLLEDDVGSAWPQDVHRFLVSLSKRAAGRESGRGGTETSGREPAQDTGAAAKSAARHPENEECGT